MVLHMKSFYRIQTLSFHYELTFDACLVDIDSVLFRLVHRRSDQGSALNNPTVSFIIIRV